MFSTKVPRIVVSENVLIEILNEANKHPHTETGAALLGLETKDIVYVIGTIVDLMSASRSAGLFVNGGDFHARAADWLITNWEIQRQRNPRNRYYRLDLKHVGDWHKHPGSMSYLSGKDISTIRSIIRDPKQNRHQLLTPIVITPNGSAQKDVVYSSKETIVYGKGYQIFWYHTGESLRTVPCEFDVVPANAMPSLAPLPWVLTAPELFTKELNTHRDNGCSVQCVYEDINNDGIAEILFLLENPHWDYSMVMITPWDYPARNGVWKKIKK